MDLVQVPLGTPPTMMNGNPIDLMDLIYDSLGTETYKPDPIQLLDANGEPRMTEKGELIMSKSEPIHNQSKTNKLDKTQALYDK